MGAASDSLKIKHQFLDCSHDTDKNAFRRVGSGNFVVDEKSQFNPTSSCFVDVSPNHNSEVFMSSDVSAPSVSCKQYTHL